MRGLGREVELREALAGEDIASRPVVFRGIDLGQTVDLVVDLGQGRVLAVEVLCGDDAVRVLPLPAARIDADEIDVGSPLAVLDAAHASFYYERGRRLAALRGAPVTRGKAELGRLDDVVFLADGQIVELVLQARDGRRRVPLDDRLAVANEPFVAG
jgi:hypothetical protein